MTQLLIDKLNEVETLLKHQPGRHPQKSHAGKRGGGSKASGAADGHEKLGIKRSKTSTSQFRAEKRVTVSNKLRSKFGGLTDDGKLNKPGANSSKVTTTGRKLGFRTVKDVERGLSDSGYEKNKQGAWQDWKKDHAITVDGPTGENKVSFTIHT
jgi:hypothetical protein